jgi:protein associated with RNAse G/E
MIGGKYIDFDIDSSIVEKKSLNIVYMQYFHERGKSKKMGSLFSSDLERFCRPCQTRNVNKSNQKNYLL